MIGFETPLAFDLVFGAALGGALGSFLGCAAYRLPRRISLAGRSHCPGCDRRLKGIWMIPVFSWLAFRGRARCCGAPLSHGYLIYEAASIAAGMLAAALVGFVWALLGVIALAVALNAIAAARASN